MIRAIMRAIDLVVPDVHKRIEFVAGIISEIHEPSHEVENIPRPVTPQESTETKIMVNFFSFKMKDNMPALQIT